MWIRFDLNKTTEWYVIWVRSDPIRMIQNDSTAMNVRPRFYCEERPDVHRDMIKVKLKLKAIAQASSKILRLWQISSISDWCFPPCGKANLILIVSCYRGYFWLLLKDSFQSSRWEKLNLRFSDLKKFIGHFWININRELYFKFSTIFYDNKRGSMVYLQNCNKFNLQQQIT